MQFLWDDSYNIGNKKIDAQHQFVFELAEKMINATAKSELIKYFMMLYQHIGEHFKEEETLFSWFAHFDTQFS